VLSELPDGGAVRCVRTSELGRIDPLADPEAIDSA
jgi:hypothetical protein